MFLSTCGLSGKVCVCLCVQTIIMFSVVHLSSNVSECQIFCPNGCIRLWIWEYVMAISIIVDLMVQQPWASGVQGVRMTRGHRQPGVLAFQAWQNRQQNWMIHPRWRRNRCALLLGLYCQTSSESSRPIQSYISCEVRAEQCALTEEFLLCLLRWTSASCSMMSD